MHSAPLNEAASSRERTITGGSVRPKGKLVERGERLCLDCGRRHDLYERPDGKLSWADPGDGHAYRAESWEQAAGRLEAGIQEALDYIAERANAPAAPTVLRTAEILRRALAVGP